MSEIVTHGKPDAIWLYDYNSLLAMDDCPVYVVILSERDINIIWQSVINIDRFRSRVFTAKNGKKYTIADLDQWGLFREWVSDMNVHMGEFMACNGVLEGILEALQTLANRDCCPSGTIGGGSAGAGVTDAPPSTQETTEEAREGDPPVGHSSWSEYDAVACKVAAKIIDDMRSDIAQGGILAAGIVSFQSLAPVLLAAFFTPVPFDDLLIVAFLFIQILAIAISISELTSLLEDNKDELVCEMLSGTDVNSSISTFTAKIEELCAADGEISGFGTLGVKAASDLINSFATVASFNRIYETPVYELPDYECDCGPEALVQPSNFGGCTPTLTDGNFGSTYTVSSCTASVFGSTRSLITMATTETGVERSFTNPTLTSGSDGTWVLQWVDEDGNPDSQNLTEIAEFPDPLVAESYQLVRGVPGDTNPFEFTHTVSVV